MSDFKDKMHQIQFGWGPAAWGSLQRSPTPLAGCRGPTSKERGGEWEADGELTRDWKSRNWKTRHQAAGLENVGLENARTDWLWKADQA